MLERIKNIVLRMVLWLSILILGVFMLLTIIIRIPSIQTKIVTELSDDLSNLVGLNVQIGEVDLNWYDALEIKEVTINDHHDSSFIYLKKANINFSITSFLNRKHRILDKVSVEGGEIILLKHTLEEAVNFTVFIDSLKTNVIKGTGKNRFSIRRASLDQVDVHYDYLPKDQLAGVFDLNHFDIENLNGELSDFSIHSDTVEFNAINLNGYENNIDLPLNHLSTKFLLCQKSLNLARLDLHAGNSHLTDSITFTYNKMADMSEFLDKVRMNIHLVDSRIFTGDLGKFSPYFKDKNDIYTISGNYLGNVPDFQVKNLSVQFGERSYVNGNLSFSGLPNFEETFITARFSDADVYLTDVRKYSIQKIYNSAAPLSHLKMNGSFNGFPNDFVADGEFITDLGIINSDINLKTRDASYSGNLMMRNFNLGQYFNDPTFGLVSLQGNIKGKGFTLSDADFILKGNIEKIGIKDYEYVNIITDARFASEFFEGSMSIDDPNLKFTADGTINLREGSNKVYLKAELDTALLHNLNLSKQTVAISTGIDLDIVGLQVDSVQGKADFRNLQVETDFNSLSVDDLYITSKIEKDSYRELELFSEKVDAKIFGHFSITQAYKDILKQIKEYKLNIENDSEAISEYYSQKVHSDTQYDLTYDFDVKDINSLVQLFVPDLSISKSFEVDGTYSYGYTTIFSLYSSIDSIVFKNNQFIGNSFDLFTSKISDSTDVLAQFQIYSDEQIIGTVSNTSNLFSELIWDKSKVDYSVFVEQEELNNYARLLGNIYFKTDSTQFVINPSDIQLLSEQWNVIPDNEIVLSGKNVHFENVGLRKLNEMVKVDGNISTQLNETLNIVIQNLHLNNLNSILTREIEGVVNADIGISDYYADRKYEINGEIDSLLIDNFYVGEITTLSHWDREKRRFDLGFSILRENLKVLDVSGEFYPGQNDVDLKVDLDKTDIHIAETFIKDFFSDLQGKATGTFYVKGDPRNPTFSGEGRIEQGGVMVNLLNTRYTLNSDVLFQDNEMGFRNLLVTDKNSNNAIFNGGFFHEGNGVFRLDFESNFTNLEALNTTIQDSDIFYGTALGSGTMRVSGYPSNLSMKVTAETNRGTRIFIPLSGESSINQEEYIQFVSFTQEEEIDSTAVESEKGTKIKGLDFELDLTINENAYAEIIFDIKAGDIIRGRGNGNINLQLNKNGEFTMYGDYIFTEGGYNFTLYNIINKEFEILADSKIAWYGDPYGGILDINASYDQLTSIAPLLDTAYRDAPELNRRYPTSVFLELDGPLLSPEIQFDIKVNEYPTTIQSQGAPVNLETEMNAVYANWNSNEQELQKQVFSLIVLKKFSEDYFSTGGTVGSSVSEFVSNQLSYWISQVDENLEIDINLGRLSEEAYNTFQLRLSYTFLDGRLRITRDGGFTDEENQSNINTIVGDWSIEYSLTDNGNLRVRLYQKSNYYTNTSLYGDPSVFTGGFSLIYSQSFNQVKEIFGKARNTKSTQAETTTGDTKTEDAKGKPPTSK